MTCQELPLTVLINISHNILHYGTSSVLKTYLENIDISNTMYVNQFSQ